MSGCNCVLAVGRASYEGEMEGESGANRTKNIGLHVNEKKPEQIKSLLLGLARY